MQAAQQTNARISRSAILRVVLALYILLSAVYILASQFQNYQARVAQDAYLNGRVATIEEILDEAEAGCQPFPIYAGDRQVDLINVACLLPPEESDPTLPVPTQPGGE